METVETIRLVWICFCQSYVDLDSPSHTHRGPGCVTGYRRGQPPVNRSLSLIYTDVPSDRSNHAARCVYRTIFVGLAIFNGRRSPHSYFVHSAAECFSQRRLGLSGRGRPPLVPFYFVKSQSLCAVLIVHYILLTAVFRQVVVLLNIADGESRSFNLTFSSPMPVGVHGSPLARITLTVYCCRRCRPLAA